MSSFLQARSLLYEIHVLVDGRWRVDEVVLDEPRDRSDARNDAGVPDLERAAVERAKAVLARGFPIVAVKLVRERRRPDGFTTTREIFHEQALPAAKERPLGLGRLNERSSDLPMCEAPDDLYERPACRLIGLMLRGFLDRFSMTPLELLHHMPHLRRLEDNGNLVGAAIAQIAKHQAQNTPATTAAARTATLRSLVDRAMAKARSAMECINVPGFPGDFQAWMDAVTARFGNDEARFYLHVAIARHLAAQRGFLGRLDFALTSLDRPVDAVGRGELDAFAAGCLESPQLVMDLLGWQPDLGTALLALAALAGDGIGWTPPERTPSQTARLKCQFDRGHLPHTRDVLWDRVERELSTAKPLSREAAAEWTLLMRLRDRLPGAVPEPRRAAVEAALAYRARRVRQAAA